MNYYDMMRQRAQDERTRRLAQTSMNVTDGIPPQAVMSLQQQGPKMPRMFGGREVGFAPGAAPAPQMPQIAPLPPRRPEYDVAGYTKGLANAGIGAQEYADQFAGGDLSKIKSRLINIDGQMKNDYYTRGLLDFSPADANTAAPTTGQQPDFLDRLRMMFNFGGAS